MMRRSTSALVAALVVGIGLGTVVFVADGQTAEQLDLSACKSIAVRNDRLECYTRRMTALRERLGIADTIAIVDHAARADKQFARDCHQAFHPIGASAGDQLVKDGKPFPIKTTRSFCQEGYVHGLTIAYFDGGTRDELVGQAARACANGDTEATWGCAHSFGHLFAQRERGHIDRSIALCASSLNDTQDVPLMMDTSSWIASCAKGAVMEEMVHDELADRRHTPRDYCEKVDTKLRLYCDAFVSLRATLTTELLEARGAMCVSHVPPGAGREQCVRVYGRTTETNAQCDVLELPELIATCRTERGAADSLIN
jgi:hypothetical protein